MATPTGFDWSKCVFCQRHVPSSKTNCPADSKRADDGIGYRTLCETVSGFIRLGQLPTDLKPHIQHWDEGDEMESNFKRHRACWHIKCKQNLSTRQKMHRLLGATKHRIGRIVRIGPQ